VIKVYKDNYGGLIGLNYEYYREQREVSSYGGWTQDRKTSGMDPKIRRLPKIMHTSVR